ncbi:MAG TPA: glycosyltransferase [Sphingomonas sp.]|nr:glycosyltransferase [Sphingomonas sp.]
MKRFAAKTLNEFASHLAWLKRGKAGALTQVGRRILRRPFPARAKCRILLAYWDTELAYAQFYPFLRYGARLAAQGMYFRAVPFASLTAQNLPAGIDALFLQSSYTPEPSQLEKLLSTIKSSRPNLQIAYFDWFAPTDIRFAERVEPWVNGYVKKSLLRDRNAYRTPTRSHTNLTEYYSARMGIEVPDRMWDVPAEIIDRLCVSPSFSTSADIIRMFERDALPPTGARPIDLHARIAVKGTAWYSAMRQEAKDALAAFGDLRLAKEGRVSKQAFMTELGQSKLCFSPFGYGEVCWRDFEAIACGSVVIKPEMSHIEADPDIYRPHETYIPVRWDLADLEEQVRAALADPAKLRKIADAAYAVVRDHLRGPALDNLAKRLSGCG